MPNYRIYPLNGGRLTAGLDVDCEDDAQAMTLAGGMLRGSGLAEVWEGIRLLGLAAALADTKEADALPPILLTQRDDVFGVTD